MSTYWVPAVARCRSQPTSLAVCRLYLLSVVMNRSFIPWQFSTRTQNVMILDSCAHPLAQELHSSTILSLPPPWRFCFHRHLFVNKITKNIPEPISMEPS